MRRENEGEMRKRKRKAKRKERKGGKEQKGKRFVGRKGKKIRQKKKEWEDFSAFRRSNFDGSRIKVGTRSSI